MEVVDCRMEVARLRRDGEIGVDLRRTCALNRRWIERSAVAARVSVEWRWDLVSSRILVSASMVSRCLVSVLSWVLVVGIRLGFCELRRVSKAECSF